VTFSLEAPSCQASTALPWLDSSTTFGVAPRRSASDAATNNYCNATRISRSDAARLETSSNNNGNATSEGTADGKEKTKAEANNRRGAVRRSRRYVAKLETKGSRRRGEGEGGKRRENSCLPRLRGARPGCEARARGWGLSSPTRPGGRRWRPPRASPSRGGSRGDEFENSGSGGRSNLTDSDGDERLRCASADGGAATEGARGRRPPRPTAL